MNKHYPDDKHINHIKSNELNKVINFQKINEINKNAPIPPDLDDLVRLHKIIRKRKCRTILEFGVGYSTTIIADALKKNNEDWDKLPDRPLVRNHFMF
jgi:predicted O-methyltransferase YrrM|tara:strand:- start:156 stop:449 length:294 start_codon:yes stop_codon:yes gene_type:complete